MPDVGTYIKVLIILGQEYTLTAPTWFAGTAWKPRNGRRRGKRGGRTVESSSIDTPYIL